MSLLRLPFRHAGKFIGHLYIAIKSNVNQSILYPVFSVYHISVCLAGNRLFLQTRRKASERKLIVYAAKAACALKKRGCWSVDSWGHKPLPIPHGSLFQRLRAYLKYRLKIPYRQAPKSAITRQHSRTVFKQQLCSFLFIPVFSSAELFSLKRKPLHF